MNLQFLNKQDLAANCPKCLRPNLVLMTMLDGKKHEDLLACKNCKFRILVELYKKNLISK